MGQGNGRAKSKNWKDFLDRAADGNLLWKAARYAEPGSDYANIPPLYSGEGLATENEDKAELFMEPFFPPTSIPSLRKDHAEVDELPWEPISKREIYSALILAK
jgi:hypothetical protein